MAFASDELILHEKKGCSCHMHDNHIDYTIFLHLHAWILCESSDFRLKLLCAHNWDTNILYRDESCSCAVRDFVCLQRHYSCHTFEPHLISFGSRNTPRRQYRRDAKINRTQQNDDPKL